MENFKFVLVSLIVLLMVGLVGYWAVRTIEPGNVNVYKQKQKELEAQNTELAKQVADLQSQVAGFQATQAEQASQPQPSTPATPQGQTANTPAAVAASKYQSLLNDLQQLINDKIYMKVGSQGTRVGTVQTFLNIYFKTSKKVDNDYGVGTKTDVANFQKAQGLAVDGNAGPTTFSKMVAWLKKQ